MLLKSHEIQELLEIIEKQHLYFLAKQVGTGVLSKKDLDILKIYGVDTSKLSINGVVDDAFKFGLLADALGTRGVENMNYSNFKKYVDSEKFLPLTIEEEMALELLKYRAYSDIKNTGNKVQNDIKNIILEQDKQQQKQYKDVINNIASEAILRRKTNKQIASEMMKKTEDWARDFDRVADYVMHDAYDSGKSLSILKRFGDESLVYKIVQPNACKYCQALYLTGGEGSKPKLFKLKDLIANGSNIGRKSKQWLPTIGPTHPWCRCELERLGDNLEWDEDTGDYTRVKRNTYGVKRKSKVKFTIKKS